MASLLTLRNEIAHSMEIGLDNSYDGRTTTHSKCEVLCFNFLFDLLVGMVCGDMDGSCVDIAVD